MERTTALKQLRKVFGNTYTYDFSGNSLVIKHKTKKYKDGRSAYIYLDNINELTHFLNCVLLIRKEEKRISFDMLEDIERVFGMTTSIITYSSNNIDTILKSEYIRPHNDMYFISDKYKRIIAETLVNSKYNIGYAGMDSEGCSYNSFTLEPVKLLK